MRIFDCTTFFNEKMIMDLRFNTLNPYVTKFIVVESIYSHSGQKKKLNFNINDYPDFKNKIEYIVIKEEPADIIKGDELIKNPHNKRFNSLKRIEQSYDYMIKGIDEAKEDDLILLSDNDEIPNLSSFLIEDLKKTDYVIFKQLFFIINLIYFTTEYPGLEQKAVKKKIKKFFYN